jgi:hypothetical protein
MKAVAQEMFYLIVIIIIILILFVFFTYERGTKGVEVQKNVEERILNEEINGFAGTLFNDKLPYAEKVYLETSIDAILEGKFYKRTELNKAFYGSGIGTVNVTEIIPPLLDLYSKGRLKVIIETPNGNYSYGEIKAGDVMYTYESLIPVPEERIGKLTVLMGG